MGGDWYPPMPKICTGRPAHRMLVPPPCQNLYGEPWNEQMDKQTDKYTDLTNEQITLTVHKYIQKFLANYKLVQY